MNFERKPVSLKVGAKYTIWFEEYNRKECIFIKPTESGYNFLVISTSKCFFKNHLYPSKCPNHIHDDGELWFFVNADLNIEEDI